MYRYWSPHRYSESIQSHTPVKSLLSMGLVEGFCGGIGSFSQEVSPPATNSARTRALKNVLCFIIVGWWSVNCDLWSVVGLLMLLIRLTVSTLNRLTESPTVLQISHSIFCRWQNRLQCRIPPTMNWHIRVASLSSILLYKLVELVFRRLELENAVHQIVFVGVKTVFVCEL